MPKKIIASVLTILLCLSMLTGCSGVAKDVADSFLDNAKEQASGIVDDAKGQAEKLLGEDSNSEQPNSVIALSDVPAFNNKAYVAINDNEPFFTKEEKVCTDAFERYSDLDNLGRCGVAYANICKEMMPTEERGEIGMVKPAGWNYNGKSNNNKYDWVDGKYIYNRCHIIGFQLAGENANAKNLLTGTRYLNIEGNLPFENLVADYVRETGSHVLYRVTPIYNGDNLICSGEVMEGWSVEDNGSGVCFCIYAYNVQPGVTIDYTTGQNWAE